MSGGVQGWAQVWSSAITTAFGAAPELEAGARLARRMPPEAVEVVPGSVEVRDPDGQWVAHLGVQPLDDGQWETLLRTAAAAPELAAGLLTGRLPLDLHQRSIALGCSLAPERRHLGTDCSCPDWREPCRHVGAVAALAGELLIDDPWLLALVRGRTRDQIVEAVRSYRAGRLGVDDGAADTPRGADPGVSAASAFRAPGHAVRLPSPLASLRRAAEPVAFGPPPADSGVMAADLDRLVADASERAFRMLAGAVDADALSIDESEDQDRIDEFRRRRDARRGP